MVAAALPPLREDLALLPGPTQADGHPSWTLHDAARDLYLRIDWPSFEILYRWSLGDAASVAEAVCAGSPLQVEAADVDALVQFLDQHQLLQAAPGSASKLADRLARQRSSALQWLVHQYLFFRIPLLRPDRWLSRWLPLAERFFSRGFALLTAGALLLGLGLVLKNWDRFQSALPDHFSLQGLAAYGLALTLVKLLHELGHAFAAKRLGLRVPTMGLAFLVMWPMAYTDTNAAWRLTDRWQRLQVACAGIATELVVAAWATLAWALLPDGAPRSAAFVLASTSWIATLAINASPFMRFDGYFILSDLVDMPNLHARSFALGRWKLREWLFDLGAPQPEHFSRLKSNALIGFAWAVWVYRLALFLGIAVLVYHFFIKALGLVLFIIEIGWFVVAPFRNEFLAWREHWPAIRARRRGLFSALGALLLLAGLLLPWPGRVGASALLLPAESQALFAPEGALLAGLPVADGAAVADGVALVRLQSADLGSRQQAAQAKVERLKRALDVSGFDPLARSKRQSAAVELATAEAEWAHLQQEGVNFQPQARGAGVLHLADPDLVPGQWLARHEPIGSVARNGGWVVETWVDEDAVKRLQLGARAVFISDGLAGPALALRLGAIDRDSTRVLPNAMLAAQQGGHILTRESQRQVTPEAAVYHLMFNVEDAPGALAGHSWRGQIMVAASAEAPAARYARHLMSVLWREAGL